MKERKDFSPEETPVYSYDTFEKMLELRDYLEKLQRKQRAVYNKKRANAYFAGRRRGKFKPSIHRRA